MTRVCFQSWDGGGWVGVQRWPVSSQLGPVGSGGGRGWPGWRGLDAGERRLAFESPWLVGPEAKRGDHDHFCPRAPAHPDAGRWLRYRGGIGRTACMLGR